MKGMPSGHDSRRIKGGNRVRILRWDSTFDLRPFLRPFLTTIWTKERGRLMSKTRHTEAQIVGALKVIELGRTAEGVAGLD